MPSYQVRYHYFCSHPDCMRTTGDQRTVEAADTVAARDAAIVTLTCEYCHRPMPRGQFVYTVVTELD